MKCINFVKNSVYFGLILITISCKNNKNNKLQLQDSAIGSNNESQKDSIKSGELKSKDTIPDFLSYKPKERSFGNLQNVNRTDSAGPYVFWNYFSDSMSFQLIFNPRNIPKKEVNFSSFEKVYSQNNYGDFVIFSFSYPRPDPDMAMDYHADNTPYPVIVKSYIYKNSKWQFISQRLARNLAELGQMKID